MGLHRPSIVHSYRGGRALVSISWRPCGGRMVEMWRDSERQTVWYIHTDEHPSHRICSFTLVDTHLVEHSRIRSSRSASRAAVAFVAPRARSSSIHGRPHSQQACSGKLWRGPPSHSSPGDSRRLLQSPVACMSAHTFPASFRQPGVSKHWPAAGLERQLGAHPRQVHSMVSAATW